MYSGSVSVTAWTGFSDEEHAYAFEAEHPILKSPGGINTISICVATSRTRHGKPVATMASRNALLGTTAGSGMPSSTTYHKFE